MVQATSEDDLPQCDHPSASDMVEVPGHTVDLDEGRSVWVGQLDGDSTFFIRFTSAEGKETRLRISQEAANALRALLCSVDCGESENVPLKGPPQWVWQERCASPESQGDRTE